MAMSASFRAKGNTSVVVIDDDETVEREKRSKDEKTTVRAAKSSRIEFSPVGCVEVRLMC